jgi:integrase
LLPEALLTKDELNKLAEATENLRDRAFILTHYDGAFRIGETLSLKILNVAFDKYSAVVRVDGKTGPRRVRLTISTPALASWLSTHPFRNDPNAPLWVGVGTVGRGEPLSYDGARALLRRLAKKTGLKKMDIHPFDEAHSSNGTRKYPNRGTDERTPWLGSRIGHAFNPCPFVGSRRGWRHSQALWDSGRRRVKSENCAYVNQMSTLWQRDEFGSLVLPWVWHGPQR